MHELAEATASKDAVVIELHSELAEAKASQKISANKLKRAKKKLVVTTLLYNAGKGCGAHQALRGHQSRSASGTQ
jgi:hypothetical protein